MKPWTLPPALSTTAMRSVSEAINSTLGEKPQAKPAASKISYQMAKKPPKPKKPLSRAAARLKIISGCILAGSFSIGRHSHLLR